MSYYKDKKIASACVKSYALKGYSFQNIENKIFLDFGFGKNFVTKELTRYDIMGFIKFDPDTLQIKVNKTEKEE